MSRSTERAREAGFSLVEVVVALGILMVVVTALLPQLVVGIRATGVSNRSTVLKTVAQGEVEALRNLPYRVSFDADPDVIDLLDRYFPDLVAPQATPEPTCASGTYTLPPATTSARQSWTGYVAEGGARCDFEPKTGPFFRTVTRENHEVLGDIALVTDIQFLSPGTTASPAAQTMEPGAGYNSRQPAHDVPPSSQVSASVTVLHTRSGSKVAAYTAYTQIAQRLLSPTRLRSEVDVTTLEITSKRADGAVLSLRAGSLNLEGALTHSSTATANVAATQGTVSTGDPGTGQSDYGSARTVSAPPASQIGVLDTGPLGACTFFCWGSTSLAPASAIVTTDNARPRVGTSTQPAQALVPHPQPQGVDALRFDNATSDAYRPDWGLTGPLVRVPSASPLPTGVSGCLPSSGGSAYLSATGYLDALSADDTSATPEVEACAMARSSTVSVLPTQLAQEGIVRITLRSAYARCLINGGRPDQHSGVDLVVEVYAGEAEGGDRYTVIPSAELAIKSLGQIPVGGGKTLADYLESWSSAAAVTKKTGNEVGVEIPAALTIVTLPSRGSMQPVPATGTDADADADADAEADAGTGGDASTGEGTATPAPVLVTDPGSAVTISLGAVSCSAMDAR